MSNQAILEFCKAYEDLKELKGQLNGALLQLNGALPKVNYQVTKKLEYKPPKLWAEHRRQEPKRQKITVSKF